MLTTPYSYQLLREFDDVYITEAVHINDMRLWIKSYSPSRMREYAHLPTIHLEGIITSHFPHAQRRVKGMVRIMVDGTVRWTLVSASSMIHVPWSLRSIA